MIVDRRANPYWLIIVQGIITVSGVRQNIWSAVLYIKAGFLRPGQAGMAARLNFFSRRQVLSFVVRSTLDLWVFSNEIPTQAIQSNLISFDESKE